jgi:predicted acetyltransferase|tara:strand:- start:743 stop:1267 length:525 start_codon:yes stop_codon:yes gene_type:complete
MINLRFPTKNDIPQIEYVGNQKWALDFGFIHYWESKLDQNPQRLIAYLPNMQKGENLPEGHVPCTFFFAFNANKEIVGRVSIRHQLTENLKRDGGHIGYAVVPEYRNKGVATEILKQSLIWCRDFLNLNRILVTCDDDNIGSIKTIEKNGGVLENKIELSKNKPLKRRYWIMIK